MTERLQIRLDGAVSVTGPDGADLSPRGQKARGLLALLLTSKDGRRGRRWLEARLWSDRAAEQASGSLRQTLVEVRRALGSHAGVLGADRSMVWIDLHRVETDLCPGRGAAPTQAFLEGLDIRDEGFEDWLRDMRASLDDDAPRPGPSPDPPPGASRSPLAPRPATAALRVRAVDPGSGDLAERLTGRIIADQMTLELEERLSAIRYAAGTADLPLGSDLEVRCDVAENGDRTLVFVQVCSGDDGRVIYAGHTSEPGRCADALSSVVVQGFLHNAMRSVLNRLPAILAPDRPAVVALGLFNSGFRSLASFDPAGFEAAHEKFRLAHEADGNGVYLAWRAYVRMAQLVEKAGGDPQARRDEVAALVPRALETSSENGLAIALVALTRMMLEDDPSAPAELARRAMLCRKSSLFARQTLAVAHSAVGDAKRAYDLSSACQRANPNDELSHVWDLYHALVCISAGRLAEARSAAERASRTSPRFVAPRRQLIALCAHSGDIAAARTHLRELQNLEGDFTLERYLDDPDYPVLTLRRAGLIHPLRAVFEAAESGD